MLSTVNYYMSFYKKVNGLLKFFSIRRKQRKYSIVLSKYITVHRLGEDSHFP